jgi:hypothetical protein
MAMSRRVIALSLVLAAFLVTVGPALAQGPVTPQHSDPNWQASYWNNTTLSGTPVVLALEADLDRNWGAEAPAAGVNADRFSARWTRYIDFTPGTYLFTATSDDGIRVWVDGTLIIDEWTIHAAQTHTAEINLGAGHHLVKVEYFEESGLAVVRLRWQLKGEAPATGEWKAEYFNNTTLAGSPVLTRYEAAVNYNWGSGSPQLGTVNNDRFSARWTRNANFTAGTYTFRLTADDGARLWVNGHVLIDAWHEQAATTYTGQIYLPAGPTTLELQYYEQEGAAVAQLSWSPGTTPPPATGAVIVDDTSAGFVTGGAARGWRTVAEGYGNRLTWTYNNYSVQPAYNWARWYPSLQAGTYEVFVYIPDRYTTTSRARYWVSHADGYTLKVVDQSAHGASWVSLGTYRFAGTSSDYVSLSDVTYETYRTRLIGFDAMKWERR